MPGGRRHPYHCRICGKHRDEAGHISARGKCAECANARIVTNMHTMRARSGPGWYEWRHAVAASVGGTLLDGERPEA